MSHTFTTLNQQFPKPLYCSKQLITLCVTNFSNTMIKNAGRKVAETKNTLHKRSQKKKVRIIAQRQPSTSHSTSRIKIHVHSASLYQRGTRDSIESNPPSKSLTRLSKSKKVVVLYTSAGCSLSYITSYFNRGAALSRLSEL